MRWQTENMNRGSNNQNQELINCMSNEYWKENCCCVGKWRKSVKQMAQIDGKCNTMTGDLEEWCSRDWHAVNRIAIDR